MSYPYQLHKQSRKLFKSNSTYLKIDLYFMYLFLISSVKSVLTTEDSMMGMILLSSSDTEQRLHQKLGSFMMITRPQNDS